LKRDESLRAVDNYLGAQAEMGDRFMIEIRVAVRRVPVFLLRLVIKRLARAWCPRVTITGQAAAGAGRKTR